MSAQETSHALTPCEAREAYSAALTDYAGVLRAHRAGLIPLRAVNKADDDVERAASSYAEALRRPVGQDEINLVCGHK